MDKLSPKGLDILRLYEENREAFKKLSKKTENNLTFWYLAGKQGHGDLGRLAHVLATRLQVPLPWRGCSRGILSSTPGIAIACASFICRAGSRRNGSSSSPPNSS